MDAYVFMEREEFKELTACWIEEYDLGRRQEALNNLGQEEWKQGI